MSWAVFVEPMNLIVAAKPGETGEPSSAKAWRAFDAAAEAHQRSSWTFLSLLANRLSRLLNQKVGVVTRYLHFSAVSSV